MSSAGMSGAENANTTDETLNQNGAATGAGAMGDMNTLDAMNGLDDSTLGAMDDEPVVVEVVEMDATLPGDEDFAATGGAGWRWWYTPLIAAPLIAGATAGVILYRRQQRKNPASAVAAMSQQGRGLAKQAQSVASNWRGAANDYLSNAGDYLSSAGDSLSDLLQRGQKTLNTQGSAATQQVKGTARQTTQQVAQTVRQATQQAKDTAKQATQQARDTAKQATQQAKDTAKQATNQSNTSSGLLDKLGDVVKIGAVTKIAQNALNRNGKSDDNSTLAQKALKTAGATAATKATVSAVKKARDRANDTTSNVRERANKAARNASKQASRTGRRVSFFALGALVSAIVTYVRVWQARLRDAETRETAGGRYVNTDNDSKLLPTGAR